MNQQFTRRSSKSFSTKYAVGVDQRERPEAAFQQQPRMLWCGPSKRPLVHGAAFLSTETLVCRTFAAIAPRSATANRSTIGGLNRSTNGDFWKTVQRS
ncbi:MULTISPECIES: hypothetical protein [Roseobacteraceae]|uniref:hypothetical protein n=1 Tax=Roseobacteraceae TaxID=2854170 RepID=UPI0012FE7640|nr:MULTISPECIES: hypothetical protein [Roseobacteraceae]